MAITATVTHLGRGDYRVVLAGSSVAASTEATILNVPRKGRIRRLKASLTAGSGATLDPILGISTNPADSAVVLENGTAAADVDLQPSPAACYFSSTGTLYYRDVVNAGADNTTEGEILISAGWGP